MVRQAYEKCNHEFSKRRGQRWSLFDPYSHSIAEIPGNRLWSDEFLGNLLQVIKANFLLSEIAVFDAMHAIFAHLGSKLLHLFLVTVEFNVLAICGNFVSKLLSDICNLLWVLALLIPHCE